MTRRGFSLIEMLVVIVMIGLLTAILVPRFRMSPRSKVRAAADEMVRDLELVRSRALSTRTWTRMRFDTGAGTYTGYLDDNRDSAFALTTAEIDSLHGFGVRTLDPAVAYGRGTAPDVPALPGPGVITFANPWVDFDARGLTTPFGTKGVIYLVSRNDPSAVAAVTVSGGGGIRTWTYNGTSWQ